METPECPIKSLSLDEAIAHADEVAGDCGTACKREHKQLADWLRELKSRRSAERGDAAKLREVCEKMLNLLTAEGFEDGGMSIELDEKQVIMWRTRFHAALDAPPRNCDLYKTKEKAQDAFLKEACDHPCGNCWVEDINNECGVDWLLAPATKKEGGKGGNE